MSADVEIEARTTTLTVNEEGFIGYQTDGYGEGESGLATADHMQPFGFLSRPLDPDADGTGASCLYILRGNETIVLPGYDARALSKIPVLKKGASVQHNALGGFAHFENDGTNSTWTCYVPVDFDSAGKPTKTCLVQVGKDVNGKVSILLMHANGHRIEIGDATTKNQILLMNSLGNAWIGVDDDGPILNGNTKMTGNMGPGALLQAWMAAVSAALTTLGAPVGPPPISLTV
jgi:hypothetical protein